MINASHFDLDAIADRLMREAGFTTASSDDVTRQLGTIHPDVASPPGADVRDMRDRPWSSIDNDTSRDLDQVELAERLPDGTIRILVGIADVAAVVPKGSPIDRAAERQTTTVYAAVRNFPMLPAALSEGATSLLQGADRLALVTQFTVTAEGHVIDTTIFRALVRNAAQLTYPRIGAWLEGTGSLDRGPSSPVIQEQLRLQDEAAQALRLDRHRHGALNIETIEADATISPDRQVHVDRHEKNRATSLIEDLMIASNVVVARFLEEQRVSSIRRVVRAPKRWDRIVALVAGLGGHLPSTPDSKALNEFLCERRELDPERFPDLSLAIVKLMGPGEYVLERPGDVEPGHFGLAVDDYTHSTAPNRRFADLVTQRLVKAALAHEPSPYSDDELAAIARACTLQEDAARKVERGMTKRLAAVALGGRIGERFDAIVTGVTPKGTFVRLLHPPVEGLLVAGPHGLDVGDRLSVTLVHTDPQQGFVDFKGDGAVFHSHD